MSLRHVYIRKQNDIQMVPLNLRTCAPTTLGLRSAVGAPAVTVPIAFSLCVRRTLLSCRLASRARCSFSNFCRMASADSESFALLRMLALRENLCVRHT